MSSPCLPTAQASLPETALTLEGEVAYVGVRPGFGLTRDDVQDPLVTAIRTQAVAMRPVRRVHVRDFLLGPTDKGAPYGGGSILSLDIPTSTAPVGLLTCERRQNEPQDDSNTRHEDATP